MKARATLTAQECSKNDVLADHVPKMNKLICDMVSSDIIVGDSEPQVIEIFRCEME